MKKKFLMYLLAVVAISIFVSAALVSWLSNPVTVNVDVDSPFEVQFTGDLNMYGGETAVIELIVTNRADVGIDAYEAYQITNSDGLTSSDFVFGYVRNDSHTLPGWSQIDNNTLQMNSSRWEWGASTVVNITLTFQLEPNALGEYVFESRMMYE